MKKPAALITWHKTMKAKSQLNDEIIQEMEDHLVDTADTLQTKGLTEEEAYLIAFKRMGNQSDIAGELTKVHSERYYKSLLSPVENAAKNLPIGKKRGLLILLIMITGSVIASNILNLFHLEYTSFETWNLRNAAFYIIPFIGLFFCTLKKPDLKSILLISITAGACLLAINLYPYDGPAHSEALTAFSVPIMLWFLLAWIFPDSSSLTRRNVHLLRFTGETFFYTNLIGLGGIALLGIIILLFSFIGVNNDEFTMNIVAPFIGYSSVILAAWLIEKKRNIIENLAPVLAKVFIPLFMVTLLTFLIVTLVRNGLMIEDRDFLILLNVILALVVAMSFYEISSRTENREKQIYDYLNLGLILLTLAANALALGNMIYRLSEFGFTINRTFTVGLNLIMAVNLAGITVKYLQFFIKKATFESLTLWQGKYLHVYTIWFAVVVFILPHLFGYQ